ncbi:MAG: hypothetical protein KKA79_06875 [Nanoarchaeota archaeon]|nr:hypothetical protein [Nanoarchaeota archaeon]MCG2718896.1 hypothetical protein [Nanoarchaeota archaeon]
MKSKSPDRLSCRKGDREIYDLLKKEELLKGKPLIDIFMMALTTGYKEKHRVKLDTKDGLILLYHVPTKLKSIMKAIAIAEEEADLNVLLDEAKVYSIAEEYAAGGIKILKTKVLGGEFGSYIKKLESELVDEFEKIKK